MNGELMPAKNKSQYKFGKVPTCGDTKAPELSKKDAKKLPEKSNRFSKLKKRMKKS